MIRAIICDDEVATIRIIRHYLKSQNLPIEIVGTAEDGREALQLIRERKPRLVFMDINMPELSGFEVLEQIRSELDLQVIVLTAFASFHNAQQALRLGVSDILPKPVDFEQLRQAIDRAIGWQFTSNETVNLILEYLHEHFAEEIELEDLAKLTFCTESHISRLFKTHVGTTILPYIHQLRIEKACRMLRRPMANIQEVSEAVGYASLNNFYKYFKRYMNMTPAQYMEGEG